jgi:hypothetical protein
MKRKVRNRAKEVVRGQILQGLVSHRKALIFIGNL